MNYLVDQNRDYAQVITEATATNVTDYVYGDDLLSQNRQGQTFTFHYDGLGSTRLLTDELGNNTDSYDYEAFGETLNKTGTTENSYLYAGEQFDSGLDNYYLRARYYDQGVGRFTQMDTWQGEFFAPITLNKYVYANVDAVNGIDPSGYMTLVGQSATLKIGSDILLVGGGASYAAFIGSQGRRGDVYNDSDYGWAIITGMLPIGSSAYIWLNEKTDANGDAGVNYKYGVMEKDFGEDACKMTRGPDPQGNGYSEIWYSCRQFPSWPIIRFIPSVVASAAPKTAPCAPGYPHDEIPSISQGLKGWTECRFRN